MAHKDKQQARDYSKKHYLANKDVYKKRAFSFTKEARKRNKDYVEMYLKTHPCVDCGESDIIVLEFDHVRGKKLEDISNCVNTGWSIKKLQEEIDKCEVRCANDHRRVTYLRRIQSKQL